MRTPDESVLFQPIETLVRMFRRRELSPVEVLELAIERQARLEPQLNAFTKVMAEEARRQATESETAYKKGNARPLSGVPLSLKDIFDIEGVPTTLGSRIHREIVPRTSSAVHQNLAKAGAVILGKNNMLEFAYGSVHPDYGQSNNPWNLSRTTGGSSSGSAGAVAAGIVHGSVGTDTGGSIRVPASFCGLVGMKPTHGSVDTTGLFPLSPTLDHIGPLSRTVHDNRLLFESVSGRRIPASMDGQRRVIGRVRELFESGIESSVRDTVEAAMEVFVRLGFEVREVSLPGVTDILEDAALIVGAEAAHVHKEWLPARESDYAAQTFANLSNGLEVRAVDYLRARERRLDFIREVDDVLRTVDFLAAPTSPCVATETDPPFGPESLNIVLRTIPFNMSGHPAMSLPAGLNSEGLPLGIELIGGKGCEGKMYEAAARYEADLGGFASPLSLAD